MVDLSVSQFRCQSEKLRCSSCIISYSWISMLPPPRWTSENRPYVDTSKGLPHFWWWVHGERWIGNRRWTYERETLVAITSGTSQQRRLLAHVVSVDLVSAVWITSRSLHIGASYF